VLDGSARSPGAPLAFTTGLGRCHRMPPAPRSAVHQEVAPCRRPREGSHPEEHLSRRRARGARRACAPRVHISNAYSHVDSQAVKMRDQEHRALLERLFTVEHAAYDRRIGEVVVASNYPCRFPASAWSGGSGRLRGQGSAHFVGVPSVLRRVLGSAGSVEVEPSAAKLRQRPTGVAGLPQQQPVKHRRARPRHGGCRCVGHRRGGPQICG
jgi:hypothetical protein